MAEPVLPEVREGWWEVAIVLLVVVSVFGAALLTTQDVPTPPGDLPAGFSRQVTNTPWPCTPTPTARPGSRPEVSPPPPTPTAGARSVTPVTPTPTSVPSPTAAG